MPNLTTEEAEAQLRRAEQIAMQAERGKPNDNSHWQAVREAKAALSLTKLRRALAEVGDDDPIKRKVIELAIRDREQHIAAGCHP